MFVGMRTIRLFANENTNFTSEEIEILALNLSGLLMNKQDFNDLINTAESYYSVKDDAINDLQVNLLPDIIGFDTVIVEKIIEKIERLSIPELQRLYTALFKGNDLLKMIEFDDITPKNG